MFYLDSMPTGAQPSTSRQAAAVSRDSAPAASRPNNKSPNSKRPFIKFRDDKYRAAQIRKYKAKLKKKNVHTPLHLPTIPCTSPTQVLSRKILRSARKRRNPLSRPSTTPKVPSNKRLSDSIIHIPHTSEKDQEVPIEIKEKNEDLDDDCVCIEPQPEVILIDDESTVLDITTKENEDNDQAIKEYQPIGSIRMNLRNNSPLTKMLTSTPKLGNASPSRYPFYDDTTPKLRRDKRFLRTEDCTLVEPTSTNNEVVVIDDTSIPMYRTCRGSKRRSCNDSVIFVSEEVIPPATTEALAYIPLDTPDEESRFKDIPSPRPPKAKRPRNDFFSSKEQKQLREYNENAYNPNKDDATQLTKKRMVIIDGSNVAYHHALNKAFSVKGLKICLDYFEKMGHEVKAVVPQFRLQRLKSTDPAELEKLHQEGKIVFTPCKNLPGISATSYDDRFVLQLASELDAAVVSNDNYRDLIHENPAFKKIIQNRVVGYTWCNDIFILPKDPYGKWGPTLSMILNRS